MECKLAVISGMAFEARAAQGSGIRTIHGLNPAKLVADIEHAISDGASGLLSFGTAAGLLPTLTAGTIVIARTVRCEGQTWETDAAWAARLAAQLPDAVCGDIAGVTKPLVNIQEKSLLRVESGAVAADMESQHVARMAQRYNLPFAALRILLDGADCALPPAALAALKPNGSVSYSGLIGSLLAHPGQLPAMLQLAADHASVKKTLLRCGELFSGSLFGMNIG